MPPKLEEPLDWILLSHGEWSSSSSSCTSCAEQTLLTALVSLGPSWAAFCLGPSAWRPRCASHPTWLPRCSEVSAETGRDWQLPGLCVVCLWLHVSFVLSFLETDELRCVWMDRQKQDIVKQKGWRIKTVSTCMSSVLEHWSAESFPQLYQLGLTQRYSACPLISCGRLIAADILCPDGWWQNGSC